VPDISVFRPPLATGLNSNIPIGPLIACMIVIVIGFAGPALHAEILQAPRGQMQNDAIPG
jgi:hypothetical protein